MRMSFANQRVIVIALIHKGHMSKEELIAIVATD